MDADDEWYVAAYVTPPGLPYALGTRTRHDNNLSLWHRQGRSLTLEAYFELERYSGMKQHGAGLPSRADYLDLIAELIRPWGVGLSDLSGIVGTPELDAATRGYAEAFRHTGLPVHGISHVLSAVYLDSRSLDGATVVALAPDAGPDFGLENRRGRQWYAGAVVREKVFDWFPIESPALMFVVARRRYGLREGSLMALASASSAAIDAAPFVARARDTPMTGQGTLQDVTALVGAIDDVAFADRDVADADDRFTPRENAISAVMKVVQAVAHDVMVRNVETVGERYRLELRGSILAMSGGFALNCPTNTALVNHFGFSELRVPPCPNDSGQSLGLGLMKCYVDTSGEFDFRFSTPYLGTSLPDVTGLGRLQDVVAVEPYDPRRFVADLESGPLPWIDGRSEVGPRALGHRSLLADPRTLEAKDRINNLKQREWWRPVAPVVLASEAAGWLVEARPSPFMLEAFEVRADKRHLVPAVVHDDGTARVQTLTDSTNPRLHRALRDFHAATGVPMLCNTSLNDKGEPIVDTLEEALELCRVKGLDVVYVGGQRLLLRGGDATARSHRRAPRRGYGRFADPGAREDVLAALNPHGLDDGTLLAWLKLPELRHLDPRDPGDADRIRAGVAAAMSEDRGLRAAIEHALANRARWAGNAYEASAAR